MNGGLLPVLPECVPVTGADAVWLCQLLEPGLRWMKANSVSLTARRATLLEALQLIAAKQGNGTSGISGIPTGVPDVTIPDVVTTAQMARLLGCSERNVTARAQRGTLPGARKAGGGGSKGAGGWVFDIAAVADLVGPAVVAEVLDEKEVA